MTAGARLGVLVGVRPRSLFLALLAADAPTRRGASRAWPSGTVSCLRFLAARSAASFSASSSSELARWRFLFAIP